MTRFGALVAVSDAVAATRSRTEKVRRLADFLRGVPPGAVASALRFLSGRSGRERLGVGPAAVDEAWRAAPAAAEATLGLEDVVGALTALGELSGEGSAAERARRLAELFARATAPERSFLARWLVGELRQGALEGVLTEAVAAAAGLDGATVRDAFMIEGDLALVGEKALREGGAGLAGRAIRLFRPILPMLAGTASSPAEALERFGEVAVEAKLDGVRIQVHKSGERIEVYSRQRKPLSDAVPEVIDSVRRIGGSEAILDGEAIALGADGRPEPFQDTMRRFGRKLDVDEVRREMPLSARFFDCLLVGGHSCIAWPQRERWRILGEIVPPDLRIAALRTADSSALDRFVQETLAGGHEGVLLKSPDSPYRAGRRGTEWLKWKPAVTLDLVVLAAEWGYGRRRGWLSNLHLGARDPVHGGFVMIGKTFKGLTDEMLAWQTERLLGLERVRDEWTVHAEPSLVVEVAFDGVQRSPRYPGGVALRFARVKRYRTDKSPAEADTIDTVRGLLPSEPPPRLRGGRPTGL
jgi:ATP-dependent DNA ligase I